MLEPTKVSLPPSTLFPVTITAILQPAGVCVARHTPILRYKYWHDVEEGEEANKVKKEFHSTFECPIEGEVQEWYVKVGDEVNTASFDVVSLMEPCTHSVQYGGLCAICGASLDQEDYTEFNNKDRAPISMAHDTSGLKVSYDEAQRIEKTSTDRLLGERKLILVVDLDQTVIHAAVDPTIGEWMRDPSNPNYEAVKDVQSFSLEEKILPHPSNAASLKYNSNATTTCWYYVKVRPGLQKFLEAMSDMYEMHVYTMATKSYARAIAKIIDPEGKFFGDRILSRDESGSLVQKSLKRLFPVSTSMVAIIDDRGDVWKWSSNLIKVIPYNFFVGIGDINSSFLPQRNGMIEPNKQTSVSPAALSKNKENEPKTEGENEANSSNGKPTENNTRDQDEDGKEKNTSGEDLKASPVDQLVQIAGGEDNPELLKAQADERIEVLEQQQAERPLAKLQKDLENSEDEEESDDDDTEESEQPHQHHHHHHKHLLTDNDEELGKLENALRRVHDEFYKELDKNREKNIPTEPDTNDIIPKIKKQVFKGCVFLFSGILPLGTNLDSADIVQWVRSFGAVVVADFVDTVTHVIATSGGTRKVQQAAAHPNIHIVYSDWIFACISEWKHVPEEKYKINVVRDETLDFSEQQQQQGQDGDDEDLDPETFMESLNRGNVDWEEIDKEVEDFMASSDDEDGDDDDDDNENDTDINETTNNSRKRDYSDIDNEPPTPKKSKPNPEDGGSSDIDGYDEDVLANELESDLL
ncbi:hypothetical protein TRICI_000812 [Trichomonascus ciferrii]|uniref:RNA polymerase II subunit A C-terminal domain phosphatase n=1 Tax=Trichomonascus ciferrii TaxID=44093 RepID=A0A642VBX2_9ASCO|nr:hypothetical protein TRICI_000812 [Trichomonascus ciferrii]